MEGRLAQLARALRLHRRCRGFESLIAHWFVAPSRNFWIVVWRFYLLRARLAWQAAENIRLAGRLLHQAEIFGLLSGAFICFVPGWLASCRKYSFGWSFVAPSRNFRIVVWRFYPVPTNKTKNPCFPVLLLQLALGFPLSAAGDEIDTESKPHGHSEIVKAEFIFKEGPVPQCHASTIVETGSGFVAAWFGGSQEGKTDVGIWYSHDQSWGWSRPIEVANGVSPDGQRYPCWNPVLFQAKQGQLLLFYKVGPRPNSWWGMLIRSTDSGQTWSEPERLPKGVFGPIKNKPVMLASGRLLCGSSTEDAGWQVHVEWTDDFGQNWERIGALNDGVEISAIQPTILRHGNGKLQILCRTKQQRIFESRSDDGGRTWTGLTRTQLPNPNAGIDAVTLRDGRHLLVYNHTTEGRSPLNVAVSQDGTHWKAALVLENDPHEYSYPAVIQTEDGLVHVTYTWKRERIKHVVIDPAKLRLVDFVAGKWPR